MTTMSLIPRRGKVIGGRHSQKLRSGKIWLTLALGHSCPRSPVAASAQLSGSKAEQPWKMWDAGCGMWDDAGCGMQDTGWLAWHAALAHMARVDWELGCHAWHCLEECDSSSWPWRVLAPRRALCADLILGLGMRLQGEPGSAPFPCQEATSRTQRGGWECCRAPFLFLFRYEKSDF